MVLPETAFPLRSLVRPLSNGTDLYSNEMKGISFNLTAFKIVRIETISNN